mmetsp:Transcript_9192/g.6949  ORF Transcript_9192/g.6949 Transcript_9192/m.6949 type:complete len:106 (-) Transcript_9192:390-707(-)
MLISSSLQTGIIGDDPDLRMRRNYFGNNFMKSPKLVTFLESFIEQFQDETLQLLIVAGFLTLIFGFFSEGSNFEWVEGVSILAGVLLLTLFSSSTTLIKQRQKLR